MHASRIRVEIIRFGLLLTLTVALVSVATRAFDNDDDGRRADARPTVAATHGSQSPSPATSTPASEPTDGTGGEGDGKASGDGSSSGAGSGSGNGSGSGAGRGNGSTAGQPTLPITGPDTAVRIAGLALVLIAGGGLTLASGRRTA